MLARKSALVFFAGIASAFLTYLGILVGLREFRKADFRLFLDLLNPRKKARYVSGELRENEFT